MKAKSWILLTGALVTANCVSLTPEEKAVRMTSNPEAVKGCRLVGDATVFYKWTTGEDEMKRKTRQLGGNVIFVTTERPLRGEAYACPEVPKG